MTMEKYDIDKFTGKNDFSLWRMKIIRAFLVHQGFEDALVGDPNTLSKKEKKEIMDKAHNALILSLRDRVLQEMSKEKFAVAIWLKLEVFYMIISLAKHLHMK